MSVRRSRDDRSVASSGAGLPSTGIVRRKVGRKTSTVESVFGSIPGRDRPEDFDRMIREAKEERAERLLKKLQDKAVNRDIGRVTVSQTTMTITVSQEVKEEIEALAAVTGRDESLLSEEALRQYLEVQKEDIEAISRALRASEDPNNLATDAEVEEFFARRTARPEL